MQAVYGADAIDSTAMRLAASLPLHPFPSTPSPPPSLPRSLGASFHRCMDVLVKHGLRCSPRVLSMTREMVQEAPPSLRPKMKAVVQHLVAASCAANAAAPGPSDSNKGVGKAAAAGSVAAAQGPAGSSAAAARNGAESSSAAAAASNGAESSSAAAAAGSPAPAGASASQPQQQSAAPHKQCAHCGTTEGKLLRCRGCRTVYFCSDGCQRANWAAHKAACREVQAQRAAAAGSGGEAAPAGHS